MRGVINRVCFVALCLLAVTVLHAQQPPAFPGARLVRVTGVFAPANGEPAAEVETLTLALYAEETGGLSLWEETQNVAVDAQGRYAVLLGATLPEGLPVDLFAAGEARGWGGPSRARGRASSRECC